MSALPLFNLHARGAKKLLARTVILKSPGGAPIVWNVVPPSGVVSNVGWQHRCTCGRTVYQWAGPSRPASVLCSHCGKWTVAP